MKICVECGMLQCTLPVEVVKHNYICLPKQEADEWMKILWKWKWVRKWESENEQKESKNLCIDVWIIIPCDYPFSHFLILLTSLTYRATIEIIFWYNKMKMTEKTGGSDTAIAPRSPPHTHTHPTLFTHTVLLNLSLSPQLQLHSE